MPQITLHIPDEAISALDLALEVLPQEVMLVAAIKLYEMGRLSAGAAAALAGIPVPLFLSKLDTYGVKTFCLSEAELLEDRARA